MVNTTSKKIKKRVVMNGMHVCNMKQKALECINDVKCHVGDCV
jgi:hypothetical protein